MKVIAIITGGGMFEFTDLSKLAEMIEVWEMDNIEFDLKYIREPSTETIETTLILVLSDLENIVKNEAMLDKEQILDEIKSAIQTIKFTSKRNN